jgi:hypothetical protein
VKFCNALITFTAAMTLAPSAGMGFNFAQQTKTGASGEATFDPLKQVTDTFPQSIKMNQRRRILEFCPDETCHRFVGSADVAIADLKDFAYLYLYFYSDYYYLRDWRKRTESRTVAERILSKPGYGNCRLETDFDSARCVLLGLSRKGLVRLEFSRGDEGAQNIVREDVVKELFERKAAPNE